MSETVTNLAYTGALERATEAYLGAPPQRGDVRTPSREALAAIDQHRAAIVAVLTGPNVVTEERLFRALIAAGVRLFGQSDFAGLTVAERTFVAVLCTQFARIEGDLSDGGGA